MATNITFENAHSLPLRPGVAANQGAVRRKFGAQLKAFYQALSQPAPMSERARAFHYSFRALPVPR